MLACLINGPGHAEITEVPVPRLQPGEVLIKLAAAGICGTDIEKIHGAYGPGGILGHEVSGTIASVGDGVTGLRKSDRVIAHHHVPCYNSNTANMATTPCAISSRKQTLIPADLQSTSEFPRQTSLEEP